ncbi:hypothetical protein [Streptomyces sp. NPDC016845]|uniref:hypothetical protein n=1 Tax=Streptomyces sp. NPDC016845 TaxID=3364972 RepID=UPI0037B44F33
MSRRVSLVEPHPTNPFGSEHSMGIKDQFQDKADELSNKAKGRMGDAQDQARERGQQGQDELSERGRQGRDRAQDASQRTQDKFGQGRDA